MKTRNDYILASSKTAITRKAPSVPMRFLAKEGLLIGELLDYGCGKGFDADNYSAHRFDPVHCDNSTNKASVDSGLKYDTIFCNYVLNTLPKQFDDEIISNIKRLLKKGGKAYISVRRDKFTEGWNCKGTFQRVVKIDLDSLKKTSSYEIYTFTK